MELLLEEGIISYINAGMNYIISEIIALAASSEDWPQVITYTSKSAPILLRLVRSAQHRIRTHDHSLIRAPGRSKP